MTGTKRVREMGIDRSDFSKKYSTTRTVNLDSNRMEIPKSESVTVGGFTPIEGCQSFECDDPKRFEWKSLKIDTIYRVQNTVKIQARNIQRTAISTHNIVVVADGKIVPPCSVGSESPKNWVIPVQVARLGYTDFAWSDKNSVVNSLNAHYSMAEALAHQMFKESYSTLEADQKAKVDAAIRKK